MLLALQPLLNNGWSYVATTYVRTASQSMADFVSATIAADTFNGRNTLNPASDGGTWTASGDGGWTVSTSGTYAGMLTYSGSTGSALTRDLGAGVLDYSLTMTKGPADGAVVFQWALSADGQSYYSFATFGNGAAETAELDRSTSSNSTIVGTFPVPAWGTGVPITFRIRSDPSSGAISIWANGNLVASFTDPTPLAGTRAGFYQNPFAGVFAAYDNFTAVRAAPMLDSAARVATVARSSADALGVPGQAPARSSSTSRSVTESTSTTDGAIRITTYGRAVSDSTATTDSTTRTASLNRTAADSLVVPVAVTFRVFTAARNGYEDQGFDANPPWVASATRQVTLSRSTAHVESVQLATASLSRQIARTARDSMVPADWPLLTATKTIAGVVRNTDGSPYAAGSTVQLVRDSDGFRCATVTSGADGSYSFPRDASDPYTYTVRAFTGDPKEDITRSGLVPV